MRQSETNMSNSRVTILFLLLIVNVFFSEITFFDNPDDAFIIGTATPNNAGGAPITSSSASTGSTYVSIQEKSSVSLSKSFDCSNGELTVSVRHSDSVVSGLTLSLFNTGDSSYVEKQTDADGNSIFQIRQNGTYVVYISATSGYSSTQIGPFQLSLCKEPPKISASAVLPVFPSVNQANPVSNRISNQTVNPFTDSTQGALSAMSLADSTIISAIDVGKDVSDAKAKLAEAQAAFDAGEYSKVIDLAEEARQLALNALVADTTGNNQGDNITAAKILNFVWPWLVGIVLLVLAGRPAYNMLVKKRK